MARKTIHTIQRMKEKQEPITMITAYDYPSGRMVDAVDADMVLVGDSVGMVVHGFDSTLSVTMEMMIMHCSAVRRSVKNAVLVGDLPFGSYQVDIPTAIKNATRLLSEAGVDVVKLEGGVNMAPTVKALVDIGIAVHGHIGLTPQSVSAFGGYRVQGRDIENAKQLVKDALALQDAGAFAIVLEGVPARLATLISQKLDIPTIGIGAGPGCDGQVLVFHDMLGLYDGKLPRFVKQYAQIGTDIESALAVYRDEVRNRSFPASEHEYDFNDDVWETIQKEFGAE